MKAKSDVTQLLSAVMRLTLREAPAKKKKEKEPADREVWCGGMDRMSTPVLCKR